METQVARPRSPWWWLSVAVRVVKAILHSSIFWLLTLPLVTLSTCTADLGQFTGYQALSGTSVEAPSLTSDVPQTWTFGQDWWVAGIMLLALAGIGLAVRGGVVGALAGAAIDIAGFLVLQAAVGFLTPPAEAIGWSPEAANGAGWIGSVFAGALVLDLSWAAAKGWYEARSSRTPPNPNRGEWAALGCLATSALALLALGLIALLLISGVGRGQGG